MRTGVERDANNGGSEAIGGSDIDPITFSVILNRFDSISDEMSVTLERSAYSSVLAIGRDYSIAIYDAEPRQICMFDAMPIHTTSMHIVLSEIAEAFEGDLHEGDAFLCNHPFRGNTHIGDLVAAAPVFVDGKHVFWSVVKGHQLDCGAAFPSSVTFMTTDVYQEGLHIPPLRIFKGGEPCSDVIDMYLTNMRFSDQLRGDLFAQVGAINKGRLRLQELAQEFGRDEVLRYVEAIFDYADRRMAAEIESLPDGVYSAETWIDSDGQDEVDQRIEVSITIDGDHAHVDYSGSAPQGPAGINGTHATSQAVGATPFMYYVQPDVPHNYGCFRHLDVYAPEGSICNAKWPASTSCATMNPTEAMQNVINMAMAAALPDRVPAGGVRCHNLPAISGIDERTGVPWGAMLFNGGGGGPAALDTDGWPMLLTMGALGALKVLPIEQIEFLYPLFVHQMEVEPDSMGLGSSIGGPGTRFVMEPTHGSFEAMTFGDGFRNPPHGVLGGTPAIGGGQYIEDVSSDHRTFVSSAGHFRVGSGQHYVAVSSGGGGYGNPLDREVEQVRRDVRDGIISREHARVVCGVVLGSEIDPILDVAATEAAREELSHTERPLVDPSEPGASDWLQQQTREGDEYLLNPILKS